MEFLKAMKSRLKELQSGAPQKGKWSTVGSVERKALTIALKSGLLTVGKEVGSGGQGHVFEATHSGKQYALKQSSFAEGSRQERIAQADLEFGTSLQHECLQEYLAWTIQEAGVHPTKGKKLLMLKTVQLLAETDLHDALDKGSFHNSEGLPKLGKLLQVFHEVARGVAYLHGQRVVHCDLKHSNVLLTGCDTNTPAARVCDFGLCVRLQNQEQEWCLGKHGRGTHGYIAPEIYPGVVMKDGRCMSLIALRSDVYSMGIMLWEALTLCAAAAHSNSVSKEAPRVAPTIHPNFPRLACFGPLEQFLVAHHGLPILQSLEKLISHMCHADWQQRPDALTVVASLATLIGQVEKSSTAPSSKGHLSSHTSHSLSGALTAPRRGLLGGKHKHKAGDTHKLQPDLKKAADKYKSKKSSKKKKGNNAEADSSSTAAGSNSINPGSSTATSQGIHAVHAAHAQSPSTQSPGVNQATSMYNSPQIPIKLLPPSSAVDGRTTGGLYSSPSPVNDLTSPPYPSSLSRPAEAGSHNSNFSSAVRAGLSSNSPAAPDWRTGMNSTSTGTTARTPLLKAVHDQLDEAMNTFTALRRNPAAVLNTSPATICTAADKSSTSTDQAGSDAGVSSRSGSYTVPPTKVSYEPLSVLGSLGNGTLNGGTDDSSKSGKVRPGGILARWHQMMEEKGIFSLDSNPSHHSSALHTTSATTSPLQSVNADDVPLTVNRPSRLDPAAGEPDVRPVGSAAGANESQQAVEANGTVTVPQQPGAVSRVLDATGPVGKPPMHPPSAALGTLRDGSLTASVTELLRSSQESLTAMNAVSRRLAEREAGLLSHQEQPAEPAHGLLSQHSGLSLRRSSSTFELQPSSACHQRLLSTGGSQYLSLDRPMLNEQLRWDSPSPTTHGVGMSTCSSMFDLDGVGFDQSTAPAMEDSNASNLHESHFTMQSSVLYSLREARSEPSIMSPRHKRPSHALSAGPQHTNNAYALITRPESLDLPCPPLPDLDSDFESTSLHSDFELSLASISDIRPAMLYQPPFSPVPEAAGGPVGATSHNSGVASSSSSAPQGSTPEVQADVLLSKHSVPDLDDTADSSIMEFDPFTGSVRLDAVAKVLAGQEAKISANDADEYAISSGDITAHRYLIRDTDSDNAISLSFKKYGEDAVGSDMEAVGGDVCAEEDILLTSVKSLSIRDDEVRCSVSSPPPKVAPPVVHNGVSGNTSDSAILPAAHQNGPGAVPGVILGSSQSLSG